VNFIPILVSACLLGIPCRYNGEEKANKLVLKLCEQHTLIPVCPEQLGGLPTPREPSERKGDRVVSRTGADVTAEFERGAKETLRIAKLCGCSCAIMKSKSPSCGCGKVYDGSFTGKLIPGNGAAAQKLMDHDILVVTEDEIADLPLPADKTK